VNQSISVVVPALNEEANLEAAVDDILKTLSARKTDFEVLVVNDGSTDRTGSLADALAERDPRVQAFHHQTPQGLGYVFWVGIQRASKDYCIMIPGDNENPASQMTEVFDRIGEADVVLPYVVNAEARPVLRRHLSRTYTGLINLLFGLRVRYYNGTVVYRRQRLLALPQCTSSFAYQAEMVIQLLRKGASSIEVPVRIQPVKRHVTKAFRIKNVVKVGLTLLRMFWRIRILGR